jgi:ACT domain-containing protein
MSNSGSRTYTVRLELVDRPGELVRALEPIASRGGNLRAISHERGSVTPRGQIPVEVDVEATPEQFETIVEALQETDINVVRAGQERYTEEVVVVLVGDLIGADLSETLAAVQSVSGVSVRDISLTSPHGEASSARLRLATESGGVASTLDTLRRVAGERGLRVVEPLGGERV